MRQARALGVSELRIKSDPAAEPFYLKMGAVRTGLEVYQLLGKIRREVPHLNYTIRQSAGFSQRRCHTPGQNFPAGEYPGN